MIWGRAASSRRDGGERGRLYRISGARQLPCMAVRGKKRATTAVRVRGGGRRCSSLSPRGRGGGSRFLCTATNGKGAFRLFPMRGGMDDFPRAARRGDLSPASSMQLRGGGRRCSSLSPRGGSGGSRFLCTATDGKGTFRLFPMRCGGLTAYRAVNIAAAHWKFARKLARPPSWFHVTWVALERFRPYCFPVRAGWGYGRRLWAIRGVPARFGRVLG